MSFDDLPREIVQRCVEYLPFEVVSGDLKAVSKATRGVARRALTRGRWRPIRYDWEDRAKADKFFFEMRAWMHYYGYESDHDY